MKRRRRTLEHRTAATPTAATAPVGAPRSRPSSRRFAASLAFALVFFAAAAFTAGAGNVVATADEAQQPAVAATDAAAPADPAPADATPADPAPADPALADSPPVDPASTTPDPAPAADDVPIAQAPAAAGSADSLQPGDGQVAPGRQASPTPAKPAPTLHRPVRATQALPSPVAPTAPPVFTPATPFDLHAWEHSNPAAGLGAAAVAIARHFVGTPYVWGGATPSGGFDCSGLMQYVYAQLGVELPHYAAAQFALFPRLSPSELRPGDLVFFEPKVDGPGHVAMYVGGDAILEAPHTGALVRVGSLSRSAAALGFMGAVRPYAASSTGARLTAMHRATTPGTAGLVLAV